MMEKLAGGRGRLVVAVSVAIVLFVAINLGVARITGARIDLTEDKLYTLSDGTRRILENLEQPITLEFYYSRRLGDNAPVYGNYALRVRSMLREFATAANGRIRLVERDPVPFSEIEDDAVEAGLQGIPLDESGEKVYFGLAGRAGKTRQAIPFFQIERETFLEYDLARLISTLENPRKKVVGLWTSQPMFGDVRAQMQGLPTTPWVLVDLLKQQFEVRTVYVGEDVTDDIDVLLISHPAGLDDKDLYAIEQYLFRGGRALIFLDPFNEGSIPLRFSMAPVPESSDIKKLTDAWGIEIDENKLVADLKLARLVNAGTDKELIPAPYLTWLSLKDENISDDDVVTADIGRINMASAGTIKVKKDSPLKVEPLLFTSRQSQEIDPKAVAKDPPDIRGILERFKPSGKVMVLGARLTGMVKTAFPDGPPKDEDKANDEEKKDESAAEKDSQDESGGKTDATGTEETAEKATQPATGSESASGETRGAPSSKSAQGDEAADAEGNGKNDAAKTVAKTRPDGETSGEDGTADEDEEQKAEDGKPKQKPHLAEPIRPINVILVADADMLADPFWVQVREFFGARVPVPFANNADFVLNAIENLSGSPDLIGLRSRGTTQRPFTKVAELQFRAQQKFKTEEQRLRRKLEETQKKLDELRRKESAGKEAAKSALSEEQRAEIEKFTKELLATRKELRRVQLALRQDIDTLRNRLAFANIGLIPMLVAILAIALGIARMQRRKRAARS